MNRSKGLIRNITFATMLYIGATATADQSAADVLRRDPTIQVDSARLELLKDDSAELANERAQKTMTLVTMGEFFAIAGITGLLIALDHIRARKEKE